ncbi:hypothetical protein HAX54_051774, partial [Datura stramonium]|nr:hypothetical protein [Datura stramonium]
PMIQEALHDLIYKATYRCNDDLTTAVRLPSLFKPSCSEASSNEQTVFNLALSESRNK